MDLTSEQIDKILTNYKNKRLRENQYYHEVSKNNDDFKNKNRERARNHYKNGYKELRKVKYNENKEIYKLKSLFRYYKKQDKIETFKEKHGEKYEKLVEIGFIKD